MKTYIGIDNGVSGAIGIIHPDHAFQWCPTPVRKELNYTKKKQHLSRLDFPKMLDLLRQMPRESLVVMERPMTQGAKHYHAIVSGMRCLEATLIAIEMAGLPYQYIDSREWQKTQLPSGLAGEELKKASLDVGRRFWPAIKFKKDADAMLIARHAQQKNL